MEKHTDDELKAQLMQTDDDFRRLAAEHANYERRLTDLESHPHMTESEHIEEVRLKKLKLRTKDMMMEILNRHKTQHAV